MEVADVRAVAAIGGVDAVTHPTLFARRAPPAQEGIDPRNCDVSELLPMEGDLCIADPPWTYEQSAVRGSAADQYTGLTVADIAKHLSLIRSKRLVLWITWPILTGDWPERLDGWGRPKTGGSWMKSGPNDSGHFGVGFHWAGCSEPVLIYGRPNSHTDRGVALRNAWHEAPGTHSRKPVDWMAQMIRKWCPPGGRVVDPYAGLGAVAEAVLEAGEGRTYLGAEIDPGRPADALGLLAQWRPR